MTTRCCIRKSLFFILALCSLALTATRAEEPAKREIAGIYPELAQFNDEGECGTGAVVAWVDRLWTISYGPHLPNGSSDRLYEIMPDLSRVVRPESVGGTNANRMIHRETNQLFIGNHVIDAEGNVRTIPHSEMFGRLTATTRSLDDPANKVMALTMEEGLYEIDAKTLAVEEICKDGNKPRAPEEDVLPGYHGKGGYATQGRIVYTNNGENSPEARRDPTVPSGCLAEWFGRERGWNVVERKQFTEATTVDGIYGGKTGDEVLWTLGWDVKSVILEILDKGEWKRYRLPKASHCYDGAHGWNTEWPRIRAIGEDRPLLATMHGQFWSFPRDFSVANTRGVRPLSTYLKVIGDFEFWQDKVVFGCDDSAKSEFLNKSAFKGDIAGPGRSNSNLWFVDPAKLGSFGPSIGRGALWLNEAVKEGDVTDPYLLAGYDRRSVYLNLYATEEREDDGEDDYVRIVFEIDRAGNGEWEELRDSQYSVLAHGHMAFWINLSDAPEAEWIRARCVKGSLKNATLFFQYANDDPRETKASDIFNGIATPDEADSFLSARMWTRHNNDRLAVVSQIVENGKVAEERYYELTEDARLERAPCNYEGGEQGTIGRVKEKVDAKPVDPEVCTVDELGVLVHYNGQRYRLPIGSEEVARVKSPVVLRLDREVATERDLFHCAGTFYELPAENAGGFPKIRPIATDGRLIADFASYRGLLVLSGIARKPVKIESSRIVRSEDGGCALWLGTLDDLWLFGKPVGRGMVWRETNVAKGEASDPILATGFDRKRIEIENFSDQEAIIRIEADFACNGEWFSLMGDLVVPPKDKIEKELPEEMNAYWHRVVSKSDATLSATFIYE